MTDSHNYPSSATIHRETLPNGITVLVYERPGSQSVVIEGYLRAGALAEVPEQGGLANFTAVSLMRGSQQFTFDDIYEKLEAVGAELGFSSGYHLTSFSAQSLAEDAAPTAESEPPESPAGMPAFAAPSQETRVTPEEKARLEAENAALRAQIAADKSAQRHAAHVSFAEGLVAAGRLPPAQLEVVVATLDYVEGADQVLEFGEGEARAPLGAGLRQFFEALPVAPEFAEEQATKARAAGQPGIVSFAAPGGYGVDGESAALHAKALAYQSDHPGVPYVSAVAAVQQQG